MPLQEKVMTWSDAHTVLFCMVARSASSNSGRPFKTDLYTQQVDRVAASRQQSTP
jgi:hypothetical protein